MMENKCNKTPNSVSGKSGNKFLDHVYCSSETRGARNAAHNNNNTSGSGGGGGVDADLLSLLKENKKLKTMLLLHLDLIQEQSDQLMAKDKQLANLSEKVDVLRTRNVQLDGRLAELQKQLQRQIKRSASSGSELCTLPPPPLAKIQCKAESSRAATSGQDAAEHSASAKATSAACGGADDGGGDDGAGDEVGGDGGGGGKGTSSNRIIGECNGKLISKIILHRVPIPGRRGTAGSDDAHSTNYTSASESTSEADDSTQKSRQDLDYEEEVDEEEEEDDDDDNDDENDDDDDPEVDVEEMSSNATDDSGDAAGFRQRSKRKRQRKPVVGVGRGAKPRQALASTSSSLSPHPMAASVSTTTTAVATAAAAGHVVTNITSTTKATTIASGGSGTKAVPLHVCITPPTPSRGKQMPLMMWHAPHSLDLDESASCDSIAEADKLSQPATSPRDGKSTADGSCGAKDAPTIASDTKRPKQAIGLAPPTAHGLHQHTKARRCAYISTPHPYCTREWEDEQFICDYEFIKEEANALHADTPNLEIPKWTEHELAVSYSIEGTEDLSDETFLKRHAKFETDEKRRKKWDVQQIREQRRIEKLKRRHCKDELQQAPEPQPLLSFYPQPDTIQTLCYMNDLPVQAFGEIIPKLPTGDNGFTLPWLANPTATAAATSVATMSNPSVLSAHIVGGMASSSGGGAGGAHAHAQQLLNSSFVFLKKRRRQQSASMAATTTTTTRQRSIAAAAAKIATTTSTSTSQNCQ